MRFRVRGPEGQSIVTLQDDATIGDLNHAIHKAAGLSDFDVKVGYPPKRLDLDDRTDTKKLSELKIKLDGEQLLVTSNTTVPNSQPKSTADQATISKTDGRRSAQKQAHSNGNATTASANATSASPQFSFGDFGPQVSQASRTSNSASNTKATGVPAADLSLTRKSHVSSLSDPPELVLAERGGTLVLRIMPDDNSCLFRAIAAAIMPDLDAMNELRSVVAQTIQANPDIYTRVVLDDKTPDDYCRWIQTEDAWGGQIELNIISNHFDIEIVSIDVQGLRVDRYNEGRPQYCIVVYSGIHYDAIAFNHFDSSPEADTKMFDTADTVILASAVELCEMLRNKGYYTDTGTFKIRCKQCGALCTGEAGATEHATKTGHYSFDEGG